MTTAVHSWLKGQLRSAAGELIPRGANVAVIGFPNYPNAGDSAIWLGELALLRDRDATITYTCEDWAYGRRALARALERDGMLVLHGGGNLGDEWPTYQHYRERVLRDFPDVPAVLMPQTAQFNDPEALARARGVFQAHRDLTVLVRDHASLETVRDGLGVRARLCPDAAFALDPPGDLPPVGEEVLWLSRTDGERRAERLVPPSGRLVPHTTLDWLVCRRPGDPGFSWHYQAMKLASVHLGGEITKRPRGHRPAPVLNALHAAIGRDRVEFAWRLLAAAPVVVTDRLHAHILCLMLDKPHVVVETGYGKIRRFIEAWSEKADHRFELADGAGDAAEKAEAMLDRPAVRAA